MSSQSASDRRHYSRVNFQHELTLRDEHGKLYPGAFTDVSLRGMFFWSEELPPKGAKVRGSMPLGDGEMVVQGEVLRIIPDQGAAIRFVDMDVESFGHLRRLVSLNMGDSERIDQEFFSSL
ncbi:MAG: PilZ domain-containing protein [Magnetococcales bacterium]|nr:PilZ domain-containing protein [Magnetococcales bacterium]